MDTLQEMTRFGGLSRSALMSRIRGSDNATTELRFLFLLRAAGLKGWRRNYPLLGKPDFTFPKSRLVVFIDGCFWHGHSCSTRKPKVNPDAWAAKFARNKKRDSAVTRQLRRKGWSVIRIWECSLAKRPESCLQRVIRATSTTHPDQGRSSPRSL
jgi:DNA mismatch endonuclease (patch repair protein)